MAKQDEQKVRQLHPALIGRLKDIRREAEQPFAGAAKRRSPGAAGDARPVPNPSSWRMWLTKLGQSKPIVPARNASKLRMPDPQLCRMEVPRLRPEAKEAGVPGSTGALIIAPGSAPLKLPDTAIRAGRYCWDAVASSGRYLFAPTDDLSPGATLSMAVARGLDGELKRGLRLLLFALVTFGAASIFIPLAGAVVVPGSLVVKSSLKKVQHPTGGVVAAIEVHDGMHVHEGDVLIRLDQTQARANLEVPSKQLDEIRARIARLIGERDGAADITFPPELDTKASLPDVRQVIVSERALFKARLEAREKQKSLLGSRIAQLSQQIGGYKAQLAAKSSESELITRELEGVQTLYEKQLVPLTRVTSLRRENSRLEGERGQLTSAVAETEGKISEAELQIGKVDQDFRAEVMKDLREAQDKEAELAQRAIAAQDTLDRIELRAPSSGTVHELVVHTVGGVIRPGDTLMEIVPDDDDLQIEARLQPNDINQVHAGQEARIRLSSLNQGTTPELTAAVFYVSSDLTRDPQTNASYYTVRASIPDAEKQRLGSLQLVAGMPAEVFLQTGSRNLVTYLLKPITDQFGRVFAQR